MNNELKECTLYVDGMHCAACEVLIEKEMLKQEGVEFVEATTRKGEVRLEYSKSKPDIAKLNKIFKKDNYRFLNEEIEPNRAKPFLQLNSNGQLIINKKRLISVTTIILATLTLILGFIFVNKLGIASLISVNSNSALPAFFLFGLLAGASSCAALVGGIVLSMSKQWSQAYGKSDSFAEKSQPHFLFNIGRIVAFVVIGFLLGSLGSVIGNIFDNTLLFSLITLIISFVMIALALQMIGVKAFQGFQIKMPKLTSKFAADETNFQGKFTPFIMGALSFILPCGFTITAYSMALLSGNPIQGALIMLLFVLGTTPMLLTIGLTSVQFTQKPHLSKNFLKVAGLLVLFFGVYNINSQLNVLGLPSLDDLTRGGKVEASADDLPPIVDGKQILKMDALASGYSPNVLNVRAGIPVVWEITDKGTSGCTNGVISKGLFDGQINLTPGEISAKEFTPNEPGRFKFSCWMGMISGIINVLDEGEIPEVDAVADSGDAETIPSGATGCGGDSGDGQGCSGGCGGGCGNEGCPYAE